MIWVTADWHFNHNKPFIYEPRGYSSIEEMNKDIIEKHNSLVTPEDDVFCLGDLCLGGADSLEENRELIKRMNGLIHIVRGNHDTDKRLEMYSTLPNVVEIQNSIYLKYLGYHFYLSHFPAATTNFDNDKPLKQRTICLCGHNHTTNPFANIDIGAFHVELDSHYGYPRSLDSIIMELESWRKDN